ncbi:SPRY-domain-containing protein [Pseudovirgaria hyperparasitica]|uniref:SPRY-domain-containing protein n=1 Tax=Pseudovirgaria hyperparasitica TaxID=470096 RepID=A0A6A6VSB9_9PEZI|nr:SPRY-domain-containing protein [Pseudovirgaria hyperparasitica]KAF2753113.1 SPRY-domain-containing protein [Pseudovirgaria hyperparasitica]
MTSTFFIPSYLKGSRHAERLEEAYKAKVRIGRDGRSDPSSNPGSLSTSSSSVNLHKMVPSHRGMTHEIVERVPVIVEGPVAPLPSRWNDADKHHEILLKQPEGLDVQLNSVLKGPQDEGAAIRTDHPMPRACGIYYYEVTVQSRGKEIFVAIGFTDKKTPMNRLPGWEPNSWAWHGDDGNSFCCQQSGKPYGPKFVNGDTIGCGVNFRDGTAFFTRNGTFLKQAFKDIRSDIIYPAIGLKKPGELLKANFGQTPFLYDIDSMMRSEKLIIQRQISAASIKSLSVNPSETEQTLVQRLIMQYLAHDGYVETAQAFAQEITNENRALTGQAPPYDWLVTEEDVHAVNRQKIRSAILEGNIDKALKLTKTFYPAVLEDNETIEFQLKRRKFIEMMKKIADLQSALPSKSRNSTNGHANDYEGVFDHQMELDDQLNAGNGPSDWDKMDTEDGDVHERIDQLTNEAIQYGTELRSEFSKDPRREITKSLNTAFALMAYHDPKDSVIGSMLNDEERVSVAEELNSAILVSLGKSSSAALERLCQQTEVLVSELGEAGGAGAFINVRKDFLRD